MSTALRFPEGELPQPVPHKRPQRVQQEVVHIQLSGAQQVLQDFHQAGQLERYLKSDALVTTAGALWALFSIFLTMKAL